MTSTSKPRRSSKPSIKYTGSLVDGASFELADFTDKDCSPSSCDNSRKIGRKSESGSSEILSTPELVSKVGQIWDCASHPLAFLQPRTKVRHNNDDFTEANVLFHSVGRGDIRSSLPSESECQCVEVNSTTVGHVSLLAREDLHFLEVSSKISTFGPQSWNFLSSLLRDSSNCKENLPTALEISYKLRENCRWMSKLSDTEPKEQLDYTLVESQKTDNERTGDNNLRCTNNLASTLSTECPDHNHQRTDVTCDVLRTPISRNREDSHVSDDCQLKDEDVNLSASERRQTDEAFLTIESENEVLPPTHSKSNYGVAKQEHAFAGALAGLSVSLCLHPVDTVKTVIQTCPANQSSINYIGRSIISERGVTGLYRGIASNIASSAPISAVYAFTYESVKGLLLPLLPVEYQSLAHCTAGGCASIATSFIFTPSERIKQQMQVSSHYQNCWKAIVGIMRTGGLSSLYAGWGAVLSRNVPHSIIKFYMYENLKKLTSSSQETNTHPNTSQTLICGGLAGSTAAIFTTPFDVVKTRLQTQIPGSIRQYDGVLNTLISIGKHEGLKGLYRGLIPRLFMYLSQGAIFFGSYESFKRLFSLEVPNLYTETTKHLPTIHDEAP